MKIIISILLKFIYFPIGYTADALDFIAGRFEEFDEAIKNN